MVPGSTLMYGSILSIVTLRPLLSNSAPIDAAARPLPKDETTPPVTKMNLVFTVAIASFHLIRFAGSVQPRANPRPYQPRSTAHRLQPHKSGNRFGAPGVAPNSRSAPARSVVDGQT